MSQPWGHQHVPGAVPPLNSVPGQPWCHQRVPTMLLLLLLLLLCGALGCAAEQAAPLAFTMLQLTRVYKGNSMFWGNASLNGELSHLLDELNVTQVLPLEPPDAWARRQNEVIAYLRTFRQLVQLFNKERPTNFTNYLSCHLGCSLFPNGTAQSFYEVTLNRTAFLSFHVPSATWERRWPRELPVATFAQAQLMKYPITTQDLQYFLNTTCVSLLQAQSARTGKVSSRPHAPLVLGLILGSLALLGMALSIFLCTGGSCYRGQLSHGTPWAQRTDPAPSCGSTNTLWRQGTDPSFSQGSSKSPEIHHHTGEAGAGSIIPA